MKKVIVGALLLSVWLGGSSHKGLAQTSNDDLYIFGFSQVIFNHKEISSTVKPIPSVPTGLDIVSRSNSFALHQVNLFFQKSINDRTIFFLNLEAAGSYSSKIPSGSFEIPEGWISFQLTNNISLKTGLLLPKFNNLTEIKNRLPLFPYLVRPLVYESLLSNLFQPEDYLPNNAYVQLYGLKDISDNYLIDFAFFIGNSENSFFSKIPAGVISNSEEGATLYRGEDLNTAMLFGGRIGIENSLRTQKIGVSFTVDEDNRTEVEASLFRLPELSTPVLGEIPRYRIGADLSFSLSKIAFEGEFMGAFHDHSKVREIAVFQNANLNKHFYYSNITYNHTEQLFLFGYYSSNRDNSYEFVAPNSPSQAGLSSISLGGGWRISDGTVFKIQMLSSHVRKNDYVDTNVRFITLGISTIF